MPLKTLKAPHRDGWTELLTAWGALLDRWEQLSSSPDEYDVGYWHCEESVTALLCSAAWRSGGAGLVEFATGRRRMIRQQSGDGWGDAWLRLGTNWYTLEAKLCWRGEDVKACIEDARTQVRMLPDRDRAGSGMILCYCVPEIRGEPEAGLFDTLTADLGREFPNAHVLVGYKPINKSAPAYEGTTYPGMVVVGEIVSWA